MTTRRWRSSAKDKNRWVNDGETKGVKIAEQKGERFGDVGSSRRVLLRKAAGQASSAQRTLLPRATT